MRIAVGSDHAGFPLKASVIEAVKRAGHDPLDLGTYNTNRVDYVDYAEKVGLAVVNGEVERGILLCGSGVGACIAANKIPGIYACICHDPYSAHQGVEHDGMNVLCLGGKVIGEEIVFELVPLFLNAKFIGNEVGKERYLRRLQKIKILEEKSQQEK
jgi:ribose 5-phosphate isomerase B